MTAAVKGGGSQPPSDRLLSAKEAADYIGVSFKRLYAFCNDGSLRHLRLADTKAGVLRFRKLWLDSWAEAKATGGATPARAPRPKPRSPVFRRYRYRVMARYDAIPFLKTLATARTLAEALQLAAVQAEESLVIYNTNAGNFLITGECHPLFAERSCKKFRP